MHAFLSTEFVYLFNIVVKSGHSRTLFSYLNDFSTLAMRRRYVKLGGYMAWLVLFSKLA